jgi:uncharacterized protein (DUF1501 family)
MNRREFMIGCSASIAAMAGSRITSFGFSPTDSSELFVYIFLRGGCDGLNLVGPANDPSYISERPPELRIIDSGDSQGLRLDNGFNGLDFRLHAKASELKELYDHQALAIIHAAGLTNGTRSHFDAQDLIERGTVNNKNLPEGWFTRYLDSTSSIDTSTIFPSIAISATMPSSFLGSNSTLAIQNIGDYKLRGDARLPQVLQNLYNGKTFIDKTALEALRSIQYIDDHIEKDSSGKPVVYIPGNNAAYPDNSPLARSLKTLAQIIKMDMGLQVATIDYGGWDTHEHQTSVFNNLTESLSKALGAFYNDINAANKKVTVLVMSEFGRRLRANKSGGTDHGHGNMMLVLGDYVKGGKMYGNWPGLDNQQLDNQVDLAVTTDYRMVLSEIIAKRLNNPKVGHIFPGLSDYKPLNFIQGDDSKVQLLVK